MLMRSFAKHLRWHPPAPGSSRKSAGAQPGPGAGRHARGFDIPRKVSGLGEAPERGAPPSPAPDPPLRTPMATSARSLLLLLLGGLALVPSANADPAVFNVVDFGVTGQDIKLDTAAIQRAIDACSAHGGGRVIIPAGAKISIASIELKTHVDLHLERGSLLE